MTDCGGVRFQDLIQGSALIVALISGAHNLPPRFAVLVFLIDDVRLRILATHHSYKYPTTVLFSFLGGL
jgi:hypothetical protein